MKKLFFIMMAMMASFSVYAETVKNGADVDTSAVAENRILWSVKEVTLSNAIYPYQMSVSVPPGTIVGISGPTFPNMQNWSVSGSTLTINLMARDFFDFDPGMKGIIEIYMANDVCYYIEINFK